MSNSLRSNSRSKAANRKLRSKGTLSGLSSLPSANKLLEQLLAKGGISKADLDSYRAAKTAAATKVKMLLAQQMSDPLKQEEARDFLKARAQMGRILASASGSRMIPMTPQTGGLKKKKLGHKNPPPPPPPADALLNDGGMTHATLETHGHGSGISWPWSSDDDAGVSESEPFFQATFIPPTTSIYTFRTGVIFSGTYFLFSDDGWSDSCEASCEVSAGLQLRQELPSPMMITQGVFAQVIETGDDEELWGRDSQNISESGVALGAVTVEIQSLLFANIPVQIQVSLDATTYARGHNTTAALDFSETAGGLLCFGIWESS